MKTRRRKTPTIKHRKKPTAVRRRVSSAADLQKQLDQRTRELAEALEQQKATSEVLRVISSSPGELEPVFNAMLANATRICDAKFGTLYLREGDAFRLVSMNGVPPTIAQSCSGSVYGGRTPKPFLAGSWPPGRRLTSRIRWLSMTTSKPRKA